MIFIYTICGCLLLILCNLLLRNGGKAQLLLSLVAVVIALACFIGVYGLIGGVIVTIASGLLFGLLCTFLLGKSQPHN